MDTCRIATNFAANSHEDYLASDPEGTSPVPADDISVAPPGTYFYHLAPGRVTMYPISMEFSAFKFPGAIPRDWIRAAEEDDYM